MAGPLDVLHRAADWFNSLSDDPEDRTFILDGRLCPPPHAGLTTAYFPDMERELDVQVVAT